jgi:hypothetical protein
MNPYLSITRPATAGPMTRDKLNCIEFSASAGFRSLVLTIDGMRAEKAGVESASVMPTIKDRTMMIQTLIYPVATSATMMTGQSIWIP